MAPRSKVNNIYGEYNEIYDQTVLRMLPFYSEMHGEIIRQINKRKSSKLNILELGFGTGTLTYRILKEYPNAKVLGVDNQERNIIKARNKLKDYPNFRCIKDNFMRFDAGEQFDVVVSALSIHHLSDKEKQDLFKIIFGKLKDHSRFIIGDIVKSPDEVGWHQFLVDTMGKEGEYRWQTHKNNKQDKPSTLKDQLDWLTQAGFSKIKIVNKWFNFYVFYGEKAPTN